MMRPLLFWTSATACFCHLFLAMMLLGARVPAGHELGMATLQLILCFVTAKRLP